MLVYYWSSVEDGGPIINQDWINVSCRLGENLNKVTVEACVIMQACALTGSDTLSGIQAELVYGMSDSNGIKTHMYQGKVVYPIPLYSDIVFMHRTAYFERK